MRNYLRNAGGLRRLVLNALGRAHLYGQSEPDRVIDRAAILDGIERTADRNLAYYTVTNVLRDPYGPGVQPYPNGDLHFAATYPHRKCHGIIHPNGDFTAYVYTHPMAYDGYITYVTGNAHTGNPAG